MTKKTNMEKTIKLNADQAKALYDKDNDLRHTLLHEFSDEELGIKPKPFTWYDLKEVSGCFVSGVDSCISYPDLFNSIDPHRNVAPTKKDAKSSRAKHMLLQLAKHYNDGQTEEEWIDWGDDDQEKHYVFFDHYENRNIFNTTFCIQIPNVYFKRCEDLQKCVADNPELWKE